MTNAIDPRPRRRGAHAERPRLQTIPPVLRLVAAGFAANPAANEAPLDGADLIALARAARRKAEDRDAEAPPEQA